MSKSNSKHNGKQLTEVICHCAFKTGDQFAIALLCLASVQSHRASNESPGNWSSLAIGALWQLVQFNICNICNSKGAKRHRRPCSLFTLFSFTPLRRRQKRWRAKITISGSFLGCQRANPFSLASKSIFASMQIHFRGENELTTKEKSDLR